MVLEIKLSRIENVPWGFRLAGGADFDIPLTVTKVIKMAQNCQYVFVFGQSEVPCLDFLSRDKCYQFDYKGDCSNSMLQLSNFNASRTSY